MLFAAKEVFCITLIIRKIRVLRTWNRNLEWHSKGQEAAFYIRKHTACASCLTENGFMDCRRSCDFLLSDEGKDAITQLHVDGILSYVRACE